MSGLAKLHGERADAIPPMQERRRPAVLGDYLLGITLRGKTGQDPAAIKHKTKQALCN